MKAKYDLIKMAGWVAVAIGGLAASWAADKQSKEEIDKKLDEYITEKTDKETKWATYFCFNKTMFI